MQKDLILIRRLFTKMIFHEITSNLTWKTIDQPLLLCRLCDKDIFNFFRKIRRLFTKYFMKLPQIWLGKRWTNPFCSVDLAAGTYLVFQKIYSKFCQLWGVNSSQLTKMESTFLTCPYHKIHRQEAFGLKLPVIPDSEKKKNKTKQNKKRNHWMGLYFKNKRNLEKIMSISK